jgi:hypothetical protein
MQSIHGFTELINLSIFNFLPKMERAQLLGIITIFQRVYQETATEVFQAQLDKLVSIVSHAQLEILEV